MKIEFTKEQFENLLKAVYLGNWVANAARDGSEEDPIHQEIEGIEDYIFSFAKEFGFEQYVDSESAEEGKFYPTNQFDELCHGYIDDYDDHTFWEELLDRLSGRDFERTYSSEEIENMELRERFEKEEPFQEKWGNELHRYGIDRIEAKRQRL